MCRFLIILTLLLNTIPPTQPVSNFHAEWDSSISATIAWQTDSRACLSVRHATGQAVFIGCWDGAARITLGHVGPLDGSMRPAGGDEYELVMDGLSYRAPLVGRPQYVAVVRR